MERTLFESASAARRLEAARAFVAASLEAGRAVTIVAPSREAGRELVRAIAVDRGASARVEPTTLVELALHVARPSLVRRGESWLAGAGFDAVVAQALGGVRDLGRYEAVRDMPGTPHAIGRTLEELFLADLAPDALLEVDAPLAAIASRVVSELERRKLVHTATLLARATAALARDAAPVEALLLLDPCLAHALEGELARALLRAAPSALVTVARGDRRTRALLAGDLELADERDDSGTRLARSLFQPDAQGPTPDERGHGERAVTVRSGTTEAEECVELVRTILAELDAPAPTPLERIAIVTRDPERYRVPLVEALTRAGIPFHLERGARRPDPAGRAFLALLDCAASHLSARAFAEYLAFGVLPQADERGAPVPTSDRGEAPDRDADALGRDEEDDSTDEKKKKRSVVGGALRAPRRWERLLVDASVIGGGPARWRRRLEGLRQELLAGLAGDADAESPEVRRTRARVADLERLEAFALPLIERLDALPRRASWSVMLDSLEGLARASLAEPRRVLEVLAQLAPLVTSTTAHGAGDRSAEVALDDVRRALVVRLREITPTPVDRGGAVRVLSADALAGRSFSLVLAPGLVERAFPRRILEDPILPDAARRTLSSARDGGDDELVSPLATSLTRAEAERLLLVRLAQAAPRLVCSFPRRDEGNRARAPSLYLLELVRADRGELVSALALAKESASTELAPGWSAPRDPGRAIDRREADLSVLAELLSRPIDEARGRAAFLLAETPVLARALRARASRHRPKWSRADGLVSSDADVRALLARERLGARVFSATALESFAACPYRFHLRAIVRLRARETVEAIESLDPMTRGSVVHGIQFRFLQTLRARGLAPADEPVRALLDATIDEVAAEIEDRLAPAIPAVFAGEIASIRDDLRGWLHELASDAAWRPALAELGFGEPGGADHDAASVTEPVEIGVPTAAPGATTAATLTLRLRGSIDLVERADDGSALRATDHKSGRPKVSAGAVIGGGESLQPLLYALVLEAMLARGLLPYPADTRVEGGQLWYCTERAGQKRVSVALDDEGRAAIGRVAAAIDRSIAIAHLPRAPAERACTYCDYAAICGPRAAEHASRKPQGLVPLDEIRRAR
jgi:CRISPR/Cas system-associated exonuclease Cas4 (RecB family)